MDKTCGQCKHCKSPVETDEYGGRLVECEVAGFLLGDDGVMVGYLFAETCPAFAPKGGDNDH